MDQHGQTALSPEDLRLTHYCVVRADIPFGNQAAQLVHAAGESSPGLLPPNTYAVVLHARDEKHLKQIAEMLFGAGVKHKRIVETDAPYENQLMAIGLTPVPRYQVRKYLSSLPLLKERR